MDWASRAVVVSFWVSALEQALARFDRPEIFNTDQGSQFTSAAATGMLAAPGIRISMDGRGRWMDNVFIERLWRSSTRTFTSIAAWSPTSGAGSRTPMAAWRDGIGGGFLDTAVEMTLRLDNARYFRVGKKIPRFSTDMFLT
jgi:putative transposase